MKKLLYGMIFCLTLPLLLLTSCDEEAECRHKNQTLSVAIADCDSEGYTLHRCNDCGYEYKTDVSPSMGHTLKESVKEAACGEEGYTTYTCDCGYSYQNAFAPPLPHSFVQTVTVPTCTEQGYTSHVCKLCGYTYQANYLKPLGHTLEKTVSAPTCTEQGYTEYACDCGYVYRTDIIKPNGHDLTKTTTEATCEAQGFSAYVCSNCTYSYVSDYISPTGHQFTTSITQRPTGTDNGEIKFTCDCGYTYTNLILKSDVFEGAYVDGTEVLAHGIDVSKWNNQNQSETAALQVLDWEAIKALGIDFVIIRAGYSGEKDPFFEVNYEGAKAAGLDVGCYYYTYATTVDSILADAEEFIGWIEGKQFEYPVYLDLENPSQASLDPSLLTEMCAKFINTMQDAGYFCGLYANLNWLTSVLEKEILTTYFDVWFARYYDHTDEWKETWGDRLGMWQYSDQGVVGEHLGKFDLNVCFKDYPTIIKTYGFNGFPMP